MKPQNSAGTKIGRLAEPSIAADGHMFTCQPRRGRVGPAPISGSLTRLLVVHYWHARPCEGRAPLAAPIVSAGGEERREVVTLYV